MAFLEATEKNLESEIALTPCPACGELALKLDMRLEAKPIGSFSLAGVGMKVSAGTWPWIVCTNCGVEARGHY